MTGLIIFVVLMIAAIAYFMVWFIKRSYAKYQQVWATLTPIVGGTSKGNRMTGTYQGLPVAARINAVSDSENTNTRYYFEVTLTSVPRGRDWKIQYSGEKLLGFGEKRWHVSTKDDALKARLEQTGEFAGVQRFGYPTITYKAKRGEIQYSEQVGGMYTIPAPERFSAQLELLVHLLRANEQLNAA